MLINMALVYACLPVGSILMIISFVAMMLQEVGLFKMPSADVEVKEVI
jgi:TRAP-type C4-dicarboxylate transport system permease small subunit